jgi:hypothetical protein
MITDYVRYQDEVEQWIVFKGEHKYLEYATILSQHEVTLTWKHISNLYRYNKRLIFNLFKYISFFEEYLRAILIRYNEDNRENLESIDDLLLSKLHKLILESIPRNLESIFGLGLMIIKKKLDRINRLRSMVAHNRVLVKNTKYKQMIMDLHDMLPKHYRQGLMSDIQKCESKLQIPEAIVFKVDRVINEQEST